MMQLISRLRTILSVLPIPNTQGRRYRYSIPMPILAVIGFWRPLTHNSPVTWGVGHFRSRTFPSDYNYLNIKENLLIPFLTVTQSLTVTPNLLSF